MSPGASWVCDVVDAAESRLMEHILGLGFGFGCMGLHRSFDDVEIRPFQDSEIYQGSTGCSCCCCDEYQKALLGWHLYQSSFFVPQCMMDGWVVGWICVIVSFL